MEFYGVCLDPCISDGLSVEPLSTEILLQDEQRDIVNIKLLFFLTELEKKKRHEILKNRSKL